MSSSSLERTPSWSPSAGSPSSRSIVSSGSTPPLNSASRIASCSACIVRSASSIPCGLPKPLASRRSESFETRSSRSRSSSGSPVYFVYLYFKFLVLTSQFSVVVLLLRARNLEALFGGCLFPARGAARRRLGGGVAAVVAPADLLLRVEPFEHEVDRRRDRGRTGVRLHPLGEIEQALDAARLLDHVFRR